MGARSSFKNIFYSFQTLISLEASSQIWIFAWDLFSWSLRSELWAPSSYFLEGPGAMLGRALVVQLNFNWNLTRSPCKKGWNVCKVHAFISKWLAKLFLSVWAQCCDHVWIVRGHFGTIWEPCEPLKIRRAFGPWRVRSSELGYVSCSM